jgi:UTP--glucose-1-phosphate uridylyltransferase
VCFAKMGGRERNIRKAVIPAAGLGTRLLSATKEQPKEMLPIFAATQDGILCPKPIVQLIFEQLFDFGIRDFYLIVGRGKRAIEDHFTPDHELIARLDAHGKNSLASDLENFYAKIEESTIVWLNQPQPKGFGDAVLQAERLVGQEPFLVHAGDTLILTDNASTLHERLTEAHAVSNSEATLTLQEVRDPSEYGVAEVDRKIGRRFTVKRVVEKPDKPRSRLAIMPLYVFNPTVFQALKSIVPDTRGELQLTDAIQQLIDTTHNVQAIKTRRYDIRLDIGTPQSYWDALGLSYRHALSKRHRMKTPV